MARKYERGASALVQVDSRRVSADDVAQRLAERDQREAADTRTEAQRWLNDPPPVGIGANADQADRKRVGLKRRRDPK